VENDCRQNISIENNKTPKSTFPEKECPGCSAFFSCGSCPGFIVAIASKAIPFTPVVLPVETYKPYKQAFYQNITQSVWQPPKLS